MGDAKIIVVDTPLDVRSAAQAQKILAHGESEGRFTVSLSSLHIGQPHALFAFMGEVSEPEDAVGVMTYASFQTNEYHRIFRMDLLSVLPEHRRSGVARALVAKAYAVAAERGCTEVDALVSTFNFPMMRLLQQASFNPEVVRMWMPVAENQPADDWDF